MSTEFFSMKNGKPSDAALHEPILDNKEAERRAASAAIERAVARGLSRSEAEKLYSVDDDSGDK